MNDILLDPPPAPQPEKKDTFTINKKNFAIAFLVAAIAILIIVIAASGSNNSSPATTAAPIVTDPPVTAAPVNKYDAYLEHVYNNSGQANTMSKAKLIEYGDIICSVLDQGKTIPWIVNYLSNGSNTQSDNELYASIVYGAITYICDEYKYALNEYLAN
ncbi:MAG: hypothetical protein RLZZ196_1417 [Bacteroidota bacterium]|jgi:hypothetical protein